jgi:hypothetical protein
MNHFIKLSEIKLKEEEMGNAKGGQTANVVAATVNPIDPPVVCYGVPDPPWIIDDLIATNSPK